jgi:hypothetical protein
MLLLLCCLLLPLRDLLFLLLQSLQQLPTYHALNLVLPSFFLLVLIVNKRQRLHVNHPKNIVHISVAIVLPPFLPPSFFPRRHGLRNRSERSLALPPPEQQRLPLGRGKGELQLILLPPTLPPSLLPLRCPQQRARQAQVRKRRQDHPALLPSLLAA